MKPGQERIYYVIAESVEAARAQPVHRAAAASAAWRCCCWPSASTSGSWGSWMTSRASASRTPRAAIWSSAAWRARPTARQHDEQLKESKGLLKRVKDALGERVTEVRVSERLSESPACLVLGEHDMGEQMRRILAAAGQKAPEAHPVLELNVDASAGEVPGRRGRCRAVRRAGAAAVRPGGARRGQASSPTRPSTCSA